MDDRPISSIERPCPHGLSNDQPFRPSMGEFLARHRHPTHTQNVSLSLSLPLLFVHRQQVTVDNVIHQSALVGSTSVLRFEALSALEASCSVHACVCVRVVLPLLLFLMLGVTFSDSDLRDACGSDQVVGNMLFFVNCLMTAPRHGSCVVHFVVSHREHVLLRTSGSKAFSSR